MDTVIDSETVVKVGSMNTPNRIFFIARVFVAAAFIILSAATSLAVGQNRMVELEVFVDERARLGSQQEWVEVLNQCGADRVTIKTGSLSAATIEETKLKSSTWILVKAAVQSNRLVMPGGKFSITDKKGMTALIKQLKGDGAEVALAEKQAFGLTGPQLVELHQKLSKPIEFSTKGMAVQEALQQAAETIGTNLILDQLATENLKGGGEPILENLQGISTGTAIAIMIRPLGLVLKPERKLGEEVKLYVVDSQQTKEHWPIGWPPEQVPVKVAPKLFESLDLEIRDFELKGTLDAIEKRVGICFVYDQNGIARADVELDKVKVTLVQKKIYYLAAMGKLLRQSKPPLSHDLRVDEAGKPFIWISPAR